MITIYNSGAMGRNHSKIQVFPESNGIEILSYSGIERNKHSMVISKADALKLASEITKKFGSEVVEPTFVGSL